MAYQFPSNPLASSHEKHVKRDLQDGLPYLDGCGIEIMESSDPTTSCATTIASEFDISSHLRTGLQARLPLSLQVVRPCRTYLP